jgi:hypothetical protein
MPPCVELPLVLFCSGLRGGIIFVGVADSSLRSAVTYAMIQRSHWLTRSLLKWPEATAASYASLDFGKALKNSSGIPVICGFGQVLLTWPLFLHFVHTPSCSVKKGSSSSSGLMRSAVSICSVKKGDSSPSVFVCMTLRTVSPGPLIYAMVGLCIFHKWFDRSFWSGKLL